jgi:hypothetical protein
MCGCLSGWLPLATCIFRNYIPVCQLPRDISRWWEFRQQFKSHKRSTWEIFWFLSRVLYSWSQHWYIRGQLERNHNKKIGGHCIIIIIIMINKTKRIGVFEAASLFILTLKLFFSPFFLFFPQFFYLILLQPNL